MTLFTRVVVGSGGGGRWISREQAEPAGQSFCYWGVLPKKRMEPAAGSPRTRWRPGNAWAQTRYGGRDSPVGFSLSGAGPVPSAEHRGHQVASEPAEALRHSRLGRGRLIESSTPRLAHPRRRKGASATRSPVENHLLSQVCKVKILTELRPFPLPEKNQSKPKARPPTVSELCVPHPACSGVGCGALLLRLRSVGALGARLVTSRES